MAACAPVMWRTAVILGVAAGWSEVLARVLGFGFLFRRRLADQFADGVLVGLGHGGIEDMIIGGVFTAGALSSLWAIRGVDLATLGLSTAELTAVTEQLAALQSSPWLVYVSLLERLIALPFPFGVHHIALDDTGKYLYGTGEYTGKMSKTEIATGKTQIIDWGPAPSAPDYLDVDRKGRYVFAGNYYHSTVGVFSTNPFKFIKEIPVGKNPHGTDIIPESTLVLVSDKLSATMTIIDIEKLAVKKVIPTCAGPLHSVMDVYDKDGGTYEPGKDSPKGLTSKYAYESCFVSDSNVKIDLKKLEVVDEIPTHYRTGHISISSDNSYVIALNKFSTGLFSPTGIVYPVNFEMWDARENSPTYGKTLKIIPVDGEPHNAKSIYAYQIKRWNMGQAEKGGLFKKASFTPMIQPAHRARAKISYMPKSTAKPGIRMVNGVKEIHVKAFRDRKSVV